MRALTLALIAFVSTPVAAAPQQAASGPQLADPEANLVAELVVQAAEPGPAWWRIRRGQATIYILGVPDTRLPPGVVWNQSVLERRMTGANTVVGGPYLHAGLRDVPTMLSLRAKLKSKTPLEDDLAAPLRARFVAARQRIGRPAARYAGWSPIVAGQLLASDAQEAKGETWVVNQITAVARRKHVKISRPTTYQATPFFRDAVAELTPAKQTLCLEAALDDVEAGAATRQAAAEAWSRGDTAGALSAPRGFDRCLLALTGGEAMWRRMIADQAGDIVAALDRPGHAIAFVGLRRLLAQDGVIAALRKRGFQVAGPGEALE